MLPALMWRQHARNLLIRVEQEIKAVASIRKHRQAGVTLLEVMISVLVLGVGLLGVAAMQSSSVRYTNSALERTMAVILTDTFSELVRANPDIARQGSFAISNCVGDAALGTAAWVTNVKNATRSDACPVVRWDTDRYIVELTWGDERMSSTHSVITEVMP